MKYRRLSAEELEEMEQEFIQYLVSNGIDAPQWERIKAESDEAQMWLDGFSDVVLQKVLEGIRYLEYRSAAEARFIACGEHEMNMIALVSKQVDLTDSEALKAAVVKPGKLEVFKGTKPYSEDRESELFKLTQSGCEISDGKMYLLLKQMIG